MKVPGIFLRRLDKVLLHLPTKNARQFAWIFLSFSSVRTSQYSSSE
jgi:hypothetical protein